MKSDAHKHADAQATSMTVNDSQAPSNGFLQATNGQGSTKNEQMPVGVRKITNLKRHDKLKLIEKLWKCKEREIDWNQIQWAPFTVDGHAADFRLRDSVMNDLECEGYKVWFWLPKDETSGQLGWDWALLRWLHAWNSLPEDCDSPLFVDEVAESVCIPRPDLEDDCAILLNSSHAVRLSVQAARKKSEGRNAFTMQLCASSNQASDSSLTVSPVHVPLANSQEVV
jgi:hypothetical protein